jgi:hypothetical protein
MGRLNGSRGSCLIRSGFGECGAGDHRVREIAGRAGSIVGARELAPTTRASVAVNRSGTDDPAHTRLGVHHPKTDCAVCLLASHAIAPQVGRHGEWVRRRGRQVWQRNRRAWGCEGWAMIVVTLPPAYSE